MQDSDKERAKEAIDELNRIVKARHNQVVDNYIKIKNLYKAEYGWPELDVVRNEICLCLIFGFNQAAIALTNHLLESFLKYSLIYLDYKNEAPRLAGNTIEKMEKVFSQNKGTYDYMLGTCINRARKKSLISKSQKKKLHEFRQQFRNPFSHANKNQMFGEMEMPIQHGQLTKERLELSQGVMEKVVNIPITHGPIQYYYAEANALPYFAYLDEIIRETKTKVFPQDSESLSMQ